MYQSFKIVCKFPVMNTFVKEITRFIIFFFNSVKILYTNMISYIFKKKVKKKKKEELLRYFFFEFRLIEVLYTLKISQKYKYTFVYVPI